MIIYSVIVSKRESAYMEGICQIHNFTNEPVRVTVASLTDETKAMLEENKNLKLRVEELERKGD